MSIQAAPTGVLAPEADKTDRARDARLVADAQKGDADAFAALFDQYKKRVYSICLLMTGDAADAEDAAQDAFLRVFRRLNTFRGDAAFSTWLYRVVVNTVLMRLRKHELQQVSYDNPLYLESSSVERDFGRTDLRLAGTLDRITLARAIQELPPGYRTVFILHDVQGYEHHEITRMLHCSLGTSKSQLHKARLRIRELLLKQGKAPHKPAARARAGRAGQEPLPEVAAALASLAGPASWEFAGGSEFAEREQEVDRCPSAR